MESSQDCIIGFRSQKSHQSIQWQSKNNQSIQQSLSVAFGQTSQMAGKALPSLTQLWTPAQETDILPSLANNSLLSVKVLTDNGYITIFQLCVEGITVHDKADVNIIITRDALLQGWHDKYGLWHVELIDQLTQLHSINHPLAMQSTIYLNYLQQKRSFNTYMLLLVSPPKQHGYNHSLIATWQHFLASPLKPSPNSFLSLMKPKRGTWNNNFKTYVPQSLSKKNNKNSQKSQRHADVYIWIFDATKKAMYMDQMGCFTITSSWRNKYQMVAVKLDGNYIDAKPMKTRATQEPIQAYQNTWKWCTEIIIISPNWHILDNKVP